MMAESNRSCTVCRMLTESKFVSGKSGLGAKKKGMKKPHDQTNTQQVKKNLPAWVNNSQGVQPKHGS